MSTHFLFLRSLKKRIGKTYTSTDDPWSSRLPQTHERWKCFLCPVLLTQQSSFSFVHNGGLWCVGSVAGAGQGVPSTLLMVGGFSPQSHWVQYWFLVPDETAVENSSFTLWLLRLHREVADSANSSMKWLAFANARILKDNYVDVMLSISLYAILCIMFMCVLFLHDLSGGQDNGLVWLI